MKYDDESQATESEDLLDDGEVVGERFTIVEKIQSGSFGQVYLALDKSNGDQEVAVKVEKPRPPGKRSFCAHEASVLQRCRGLRHIPEMYAYSTAPPYLFIAMQLMSFTLAELRRSCPLRRISRFSLSTTMRVGLQCLIATRQLHGVGVVHRDIKPSNFMMGGTERTKRCVYLLDFGLSRFYLNSNGDPLPPREKPGFVGSTRYASPNAHDGRELGRHDDLWSLLYVIAEMRLGQLPWRNVGDRNVVGDSKRKTQLDKLCADMPPEMVAFGKLVEPLQYKDAPDYERLERLLVAMMDNHRIAYDGAFDWEEHFEQVVREEGKSSNT